MSPSTCHPHPRVPALAHTHSHTLTSAAGLQVNSFDSCPLHLSQPSTLFLSLLCPRQVFTLCAHLSPAAIEFPRVQFNPLIKLLFQYYRLVSVSPPHLAYTSPPPTRSRRCTWGLCCIFMRDVAKCLPQHERCPESQVGYVSTAPKRGGVAWEWLRGRGSGRRARDCREGRQTLLIYKY